MTSGTTRLVPRPLVSKDLRIISSEPKERRLFGDCNPTTDILKILGLYQAGDLKLDEIITQTYTLDQVNEGYDDLLAGRTCAASSSTSTDHEQAAHLAGLAGARWGAIEHPLDAAAALDHLLEARTTA
jgi:hypothetical protein